MTTHVVLGLGFGDEGKGTTVDWLVREHGAKGVVRWNGGPQASHHVVLPDGRWHGFSQFGSGMFVPGVKSHLAKGMLVEPWNLLREDLALKQNGVTDALARTTIDPRCVIVAPWHRFLGRLREILRGAGRHGSVGHGVGAAVELARKLGDETLVMGDLISGREAIKAKVSKAISATLGSELTTSLRTLTGLFTTTSPVVEASALFHDFKKSGDMDADLVADRLHGFGRAYGSLIRSDEEQIDELLCYGDVVFEGAQGLLLDPVLGFPPYVTKTRMTPDAIEVTDDVKRIGVLRAFGHRHGAGPFVSEEPAGRDGFLVREHNRENRWQGPFRTGAFDLVTARYAARACAVDEVVITCVDRLKDDPRVVTSWRHPGPAPAWLDERAVWENDRGGVRIMSLRPPARGVAPGPEWAEFVSGCSPAEVKTSASGIIDYLEERLEAPIVLTSWGPTWKDKRLKEVLHERG